MHMIHLREKKTSCFCEQSSEIETRFLKLLPFPISALFSSIFRYYALNCLRMNSNNLINGDNLYATTAAVGAASKEVNN